MKSRHAVTLVLGGARSGKSSLASTLAEGRFLRPLYLATAEVRDKEMSRRVKLHQKARGSRWLNTEEPLNVAKYIRNPPKECDGILLDCLTLWLTNVVLKEGVSAYERRRDELINSMKLPGREIIIVSNEVGMGIVPEHKLGREFRDLAGWLNQAVAKEADNVIFSIAGLPMVLKGRLPVKRTGTSR